MGKYRRDIFERKSDFYDRFYHTKSLAVKSERNFAEISDERTSVDEDATEQDQRNRFRKDRHQYFQLEIQLEDYKGIKLDYSVLESTFSAKVFFWFSS